MDRNAVLNQQAAAIVNVATREGGVDRNNRGYTLRGYIWESPPARVAWIETRPP